MKFAYLVKPKIPIRCLPAYGAIMRSKIVDLEKNEVLGCLRCGQVFRRFTDGEMVQVTKDNIDKVHVTRLQYKGIVEPRVAVDPINDKGLVSNPNTPEKVPTPAPKVVAFGQPIAKTEDEKKPEEVKPVEEATEEAAPVEEKKEEVTAEEVKEEKVEETTVPEENKAEEAVVSAPVEVAEETEKVSEDDKVEDTADDKVEEEKPDQNQNNNNQQNFKKNNKKH